MNTHRLEYPVLAILRDLALFEYHFDINIPPMGSFNRITYIIISELASSANESAKVGWARIMLEANKALAEHFVIPQILNRLKDLEERAKHGVFT